MTTAFLDDLMTWNRIHLLLCYPFAGGFVLLYIDN